MMAPVLFEGKPGPRCKQPVSRILSRTAIPLGGALLRALERPTRRFPPCKACAPHVACVGAPGRHASQPIGPGCEFPPYLVLLRVGFTLPPALPSERCALTAPFHPYPSPLARRGRYVLCGTSRLAALTPRSRTLSGTLPCGVRTFLSRLGLRLTGSGRPACLQCLMIQRKPGRGWPAQRQKQVQRAGSGMGTDVLCLNAAYWPWII
jgi:hypothetical protein